MEREPASIPAVLSDAQVMAVWRALFSFHDGKSIRHVARALGYSRKYIAAVRRGEMRPSVHFAASLARVTRTDLDVLLGLGGAS